MDSIRFNEFYERCNSRATRDPFEPAWVDYNAINFKHSRAGAELRLKQCRAHLRRHQFR